MVKGSNKYNIAQALYDYTQLCIFIQDTTLTFEQLCKKLSGFNYDDDIFDCNYGTIGATIYRGISQFSTSSTIDIYNDIDNCTDHITYDILRGEILC